MRGCRNLPGISGRQKREKAMSKKRQDPYESCRFFKSNHKDVCAVGAARKRLVTSQRRYEGACNRIADANVTFCEKGGAAAHCHALIFANKNRSKLYIACSDVEAPPRLELGVKALQASALPLGYGAILQKTPQRPLCLERKTRFELATFTLAR